MAATGVGSPVKCKVVPRQKPRDVVQSLWEIRFLYSTKDRGGGGLISMYSSMVAGGLTKTLSLDINFKGLFHCTVL